MELKVLYEFLGSLAILYVSAVYGSLPSSIAIFIIAKIITGGHLNPAVTFWSYLVGKTDRATALAYTVVQYAAAFVIFKLYN